MKLAFRVDASLDIGTGHVFRCLTLADALSAKGATCEFLCRAHEGNLIGFIEAKGHRVHALPTPSKEAPMTSVTCGPSSEPALEHCTWLGATQMQDVEACTPVLVALNPDWLIVDHYAVDARWELAIAPYCGRVGIIDDLADRPHACDLLLDQTFGRVPSDYQGQVPAHCRLLCGSRYALLRPEFASLRAHSLDRRRDSPMRRLLISMGGVDRNNVSGQVLSALRESVLPIECEITVVLGSENPWREQVARQAKTMPWVTRVEVGVADMAQLMAASDLAIGAAGSSSWERCCLGLPTIMIVLARNQLNVARVLEQAGAAMVAGESQPLDDQLREMLRTLLESPSTVSAMVEASARIVDGRGASHVMNALES